MPIQVDGFERCHPTRPEDLERLHALARTEGWFFEWQPVEVQLVADGRRADAPWLDHSVLVLREDARHRIAAELAGNGPCLPLACDDAELVVFHTPRFLDLLDAARSIGDRYVFREAPTEDVFRVPDLPVSPIFVTDRFVAAWQAAAITGVTFTPVWSDAAG